MKTHTVNVGKSIVAIVALALFAPVSLFAHSEDKHEGQRKDVDYTNVEQHEFGAAADPVGASRTIVVEMSDEMKFEPNVIELQRGDIVHFKIKNTGALLHEMVLGTNAGLEEHAELMKKFPGMEHEELYMAHVPPSGVMDMGWQFTNAGEFYYGCLVPGHYEAGMRGKIVVR